MIVSPSLLSADFANLGRDLAMVERSKAQWLHCDVMDGVFVPNISFGFPVIKAIAANTELVVDVHLMIVDPGRYVNEVRDAGAHIMNVHYEACTHLHRVIQSIHAAGMKAGVTLNPATPVAMLADIIEDLDLVLLMSVNPGFGGQSFIRHTLKKTAELRDLILASGSKALIEIDGGINLQTGAECAAVGADVLVAGSAVFNAQNPVAMINALADL